MKEGGCTQCTAEDIQYLSTAMARRWLLEAVQQRNYLSTWRLYNRGHTYVQLWLEGGGWRLYSRGLTYPHGGCTAEDIPMYSYG